MTIGEYVTFTVNITLPEGTTLKPQVVVMLPQLSNSSSTGVLALKSATLRTLTANMNATSFAQSITSVNGTYNDTARFSFDSIVNHPDNIVDQNDTVLIEIVVLVVDHVYNTPGLTLQVSSNFSHNSNNGLVVEIGRAIGLVIVQADLETTISLDVTSGDAGDAVKGSVMVYHTLSSTAVAFDVNITALLAPYIRILNDSIVFTESSAQSSVVAAPGWDGLMHLPKLLLGNSVNISFDAYIDTSVRASTTIAADVKLAYLTSPNVDARALYLISISFLFFYFYYYIIVLRLK